MKTRTILIAAVMFLGLTAAAFAQATSATFSVGSIPVTAVISTGQVELTGTITFTWVSGTTANPAGTMTINYGVPITYPDLLNNAAAITINGTAPFTGGGIPTVNAAASNNALGLLVINVPASLTGGGSFSVTGVRVAVANTGLTSLSASISAVGNAITAGQTNVVVISSIQPGIAAVGTSSTALGVTAKAGSINAVTPSAGLVNPVVTVKEGFLNAWGNPAVNTNAGVSITLSAAPSAGVTVTFPSTATAYGTNANSNWLTINSDGSVRGSSYVFTSASTSLTAYYRENSINDTTTAMFLQISPTINVPATATVPLAAQTVTYSVSLAPIGGVFNSDNSIINGSTALNTAGTLLPRYVSLTAGSATFYTITGSNTALLVPFAQTAAAIGYNTGLAISNSTLDPGTTALGQTGATAQLGTMTFYFYPTLPSPTGTLPVVSTYTTAAGSPGTGLDASGRLVAGATYTVLLTQLLPLATPAITGDFNGYMFIITNFTNAHAFFTISNFAGFSEGGLALVINGTRSGPEALNN